MRLACKEDHRYAISTTNEIGLHGAEGLTTTWKEYNHNLQLDDGTVKAICMAGSFKVTALNVVSRRYLASLHKDALPTSVTFELLFDGTSPLTEEMGDDFGFGLMSGTFGGILAGLIGLLVSFFLLIKILEILRRLDWWWISLSSPKGKMQCAFQDTGAQISPHYVGSCPWGCPGFLWTYLRLFIIFLLILLVAAGLLYLTDNGSTILGKLQWASVSALFSSISSLLPSDPKSLVALTFGLSLIWMTSSSATQTLVTLTQLATLSALFYKS
nr:E2/small surface fusion protein [synthetic construct]